MIRGLGGIAGARDRVYPHLLRHWFATEYLRRREPDPAAADPRPRHAAHNHPDLPAHHPRRRPRRAGAAEGRRSALTSRQCWPAVGPAAPLALESDIGPAVDT